MSPSHPIIRVVNVTTNSFEPEYIYSHQLGRGYEGQADIYTSASTQQPLVIKTFFSTTRTEPIPEAIAARLKSEHNITATQWPVDIAATLRNYGNAPLTIHALDAFLVTPSPADTLPWKLVLPLYSSGSLDAAADALSFLNLSATTIDRLYRPRFRTVLLALTQMHAAGFCHDDVKIDNIFLRDEAHGMLLGDLGQTRPLDHPWHSQWRDCRLVDYHRTWRTYLVLLREGARRDGEFDELLIRREAEWAAAYWAWTKNPMPVMDDEFWGKEMGGEVEMPVEGGRTELMAEDRAVELVRRVAAELQPVKKARKEGKPVELPWWFWERPARVANETVETELKVIDGARLIGLERT